MGKYIAMLVLAAILVGGAILATNYIKQRAGTASANTAQAAGLPDSLNLPKVVIVCYDDARYHRPGCAYIGKNNRRMKLVDAVEEAFEPCPYCIGVQAKQFTP